MTGRLVAVLYLSAVTHAAPFQNLDFESARTNSLTQSMDFFFDYYGPTTDLLPGWQVFHGTQAVTTAGFNLTPVGKFTYATLASSAPPNFGELPAAIEGKYSLWFNVGSPEPYSLVQSGKQHLEGSTHNN